MSKTLFESPVPWTHAVKTLDAPTSSGGLCVFLNADCAVLERRRLYCDSEREIDMAMARLNGNERKWLPKGHQIRIDASAAATSAHLGNVELRYRIWCIIPTLPSHV